MASHSNVNLFCNPSLKLVRISKAPRVSSRLVIVDASKGMSVWNWFVARSTLTYPLECEREIETIEFEDGTLIRMILILKIRGTSIFLSSNQHLFTMSYPVLCHSILRQMRSYLGGRLTSLKDMSGVICYQKLSPLQFLAHIYLKPQVPLQKVQRQLKGLHQRVTLHHSKVRPGDNRPLFRSRRYIPHRPIRLPRLFIHKHQPRRRRQRR